MRNSCLCIAGTKKNKFGLEVTHVLSEGSSKVSAHSIRMIIEKLIMHQNRDSTNRTYLCVWRQFNRFLMTLDSMPQSWEDRTTLFVGHLISQGKQSATVKSYVSAIKRTLVDDNYSWRDDRILLSSLTRACRVRNDRVRTGLPISCSLLELILFEVQRMMRNESQMYLELLYKAVFCLGYYGLLRVGELTDSPHVVKAANIHMGVNKKKILIILYSSKTHGDYTRPQKVKITANVDEKSGKYRHRNFCPFAVVGNYMSIRGDYLTDGENLFVFGDGSPVHAEHARKVLRHAITAIGLDAKLYDMHSFRIGRTSDLIRYGYSVQEVQRMGRWKSNAIFKYIRQ